MSAPTLDARIRSRQATVAILGQGYVGLPLALSIARAGFRVHGLDVDPARVAALQRGESYILDVPAEELLEALDSKRYAATTDPAVLASSDVVIICVPTPLRKSKDPDVSYILAAVQALAPRLHRDMLVVLESTTYPGTTEELVAAEVAKTGLVVGRDVFVCFSPERVDPGNKVHTTTTIPKVVGGVTPECTAIGVAFYQRFMRQVVPVSSARVAEMVKLLENTFRAVNIGLVNELALMCERMGLDIWEVIDAASTKPFGFMPFYPGPGIGGHCIPLDPMYLSWKARQFDFANKFIELASDVNGNMPRHVVAKVAEALNLEGKAVRGARILLLGVAYKKDINDVRESPALEVLRLLEHQGARVAFHDPHVPSIAIDGRVVESSPLTTEALAASDCAVLCTNHTTFRPRWIAEHARAIVDTRNAFKGVAGANILRLGARTPSPTEWPQPQEKA